MSAPAESLRCQRCGDRFGELAHLALHRGRVHEGELTDAEREQYEQALGDEEAWLRRFRSHLAGGLGAATIVFTYVALVLTSYILRANPAFVILPSPGIAIFAAVTYWFVYKHRKSVEERS